MLAAVDAVRRAAAEADGQDPLDEAADLHLRHHGLEGTDAWTVGEDGRDGFALRRGATLDLVVHPDARGRGLGAALAGAAADEPGALAAWSHGDHPAAARLAAAHDAARVRELWVMRLDLATADLPDLVVPDGVALRSWRDDDADALVRVNAAAFATHREQGDMDHAELAERMAEEWFDPAGLILATDDGTDDGTDGGGGRLLGFHWTKQHDADLGEVYVVGLDPDAQGRGLGRVLTLAGLHHLAGRGLGEVLLYVESDNTAAVRLYSGLGFTHADADTHVMYER